MAHYLDRSAASGEEELFVQEGLDMAQRAIAGLPPKCRLIFRLRYFADLSPKQIAQELDISPNTVQNHLGKGKQIVKAYLRANSDLVFVLFVYLTAFL